MKWEAIIMKILDILKKNVERLEQLQKPQVKVNPKPNNK